MIAFIPAKGHSERIPNKNRQIIAGKPLLTWTIESLMESPLLDNVYVSTDDSQIEAIALESNADVIRRPPDLSLPQTPLRPVIQHFLGEIQKKEQMPKAILVVLPTAALIDRQIINKAYDKFRQRKSAGLCIFGCSSYGHPIERSFTIRDSGIQLTFPRHDLQKQTQKFEKRYHDSGTFYLADPDFFMSSKTIFDGYGVPLILAANEGLDVDWPEDLVLLEALLRNKKSKK